MQKIDLKQALPSPFTRLPFWLMMLVIGLVLVFAVFISSYYYVQQGGQFGKMRKAGRALAVVQKDYDAMLDKHPILVGDISLDERLKMLQHAYDLEFQTLSTLEHLLVRSGFAKYLQALAMYTPESIWFNQIVINHETGNVGLTGFTTEPDALSRLMVQLRETEAFEKVDFRLFFVRAVPTRTYVNFSIATTELGLPAKLPEGTKNQSVLAPVLKKG